MVLTVEPGLYFKSDDLLAPERFRGTGVRIEDDILDAGRQGLGGHAAQNRRRRGLDRPPAHLLTFPPHEASARFARDAFPCEPRASRVTRAERSECRAVSPAG